MDLSGLDGRLTARMPVSGRAPISSPKILAVARVGRIDRCVERHLKLLGNRAEKQRKMARERCK